MFFTPSSGHQVQLPPRLVDFPHSRVPRNPGGTSGGPPAVQSVLMDKRKRIPRLSAGHPAPEFSSSRDHGGERIADPNPQESQRQGAHDHQADHDPAVQTAPAGPSVTTPVGTHEEEVFRRLLADHDDFPLDEAAPGEYVVLPEGEDSLYAELGHLADELQLLDSCWDLPFAGAEPWAAATTTTTVPVTAPQEKEKEEEERSDVVRQQGGPENCWSCLGISEDGNLATAVHGFCATPSHHESVELVLVAGREPEGEGVVCSTAAAHDHDGQGSAPAPRGRGRGELTSPVQTFSWFHQYCTCRICLLAGGA